MLINMVKKIITSMNKIIKSNWKLLQKYWILFKEGFIELKNFLTTYPKYILALIVTSILPTIIALVLFFLLTMVKPSVVVPQMEGLSIIDAATIIQDKKFSIKLIPEDSDQYPQNFIIRQDISAGRKIKEGRTLLLYVSNGNTNTTFPSLVGNNIYSVQLNFDLQSSVTKPLRIRNIQWEESSKPFGEILTQTPQTGSYKNFPISTDVTVSNGQGYSVPSYINQYASKAYYQANLLGLTPHLVFEKTEDLSLDGKIIRQSPSPKTPILENMHLQLVIGQAKENVHYFEYKVEPELENKTIGLILNDERGRKILFLGSVLSGDVISTSSPIFGVWKAGIYIYENENTKTLYKELT